MKGILVKSDSPMRWVEFMVKYETKRKFFGLIKKYDYAYIHPLITLLPKNLFELKIGDEVEFNFLGKYHAIFKLDENKNYYPLKTK